HDDTFDRVPVDYADDSSRSSTDALTVFQLSVTIAGSADAIGTSIHILEYKTSIAITLCGRGHWKTYGFGDRLSGARRRVGGCGNPHQLQFRTRNRFISSDAQHDSFDGSPLILLLLNCRQWRGLQKQDYTKYQGFHTRRYFVIKFTSKMVLPKSETLAGVPDCS